MANSNNHGCLEAIVFGVLLTLLGGGLVSSCISNYQSNRPGVVYLVHGKTVMERRFDTNEELHKYMNSKEGKEEAEYYNKLNESKK